MTNTLIKTTPQFKSGYSWVDDDKSEFVLVSRSTLTSPNPSSSVSAPSKAEASAEKKVDPPKPNSNLLTRVTKDFSKRRRPDRRELREKTKTRSKRARAAHLDVMFVKAMTATKDPVASSLFKEMLTRTNHYTVRMTRWALATTSAAGTLSDGFSNDPSTFDEWSSFNTLFDEFRVLSGKVHFVPRDKYKTGGTNYGIITAYDNDSVTPPVTTLATAWQYPQAKPYTIDSSWTHAWRRPDITPSAYWDDVASPATSLGICFIVSEATVLAASTTYGYYFVEFEVEFRARK